MTLKAFWLHRALGPGVVIGRKRLKHAVLTDLCGCGHPRINHLEAKVQTESSGLYYAKECPCGCKEFHKAQSKSRKKQQKQPRSKFK